MDTKWNNLIDTVYTFAVKTKEIIVGAFLIGIGCLLIGNIYVRNYGYFSREEIFFFWMLGNVSTSVGMIVVLKKWITKKYGAWVPDGEVSFQEWKKEVIFQQKRIWSVFLLFFLPVVTMEYVWVGSFLLIAAVLVQFMVAQGYTWRFMYKELVFFMQRIDDLNQKKLEKALEIERKSLEKVSRSDQLRMDLITNVSHDLKTPLTSMVGYLELMKKEELSPVMEDYVEVISDKTDKLKEMIESLFSLAKVSSGNVELHKETFQFNRLIEQIMADMKDRVDESELNFVIKLTEADTEIISDNMYCYRICQNLLENALKYSARGTRVFVKTFLKEGGKLCLEMTNTSCYYMDFEKDDIMERFARGDKARSTDGNGLGLAIVSSYARALGGEFDIQIDCDQFKAYLILPKQ